MQPVSAACTVSIIKTLHGLPPRTMEAVEVHCKKNLYGVSIAKSHRKLKWY